MCDCGDVDNGKDDDDAAACDEDTHDVLVTTVFGISVPPVVSVSGVAFVFEGFKIASEFFRVEDGVIDGKDVASDEDSLGVTAAAAVDVLDSRVARVSGVADVFDGFKIASEFTIVEDGVIGGKDATCDEDAIGVTAVDVRDPRVAIVSVVAGVSEGFKIASELTAVGCCEVNLDS